MTYLVSSLGHELFEERSDLFLSEHNVIFFSHVGIESMGGGMCSLCKVKKESTSNKGG